MSTQGQFRAAPFAVVFDGQSLNLLPGPLNGGYPAELMSRFPTVPWVNLAIGATSWSNLYGPAGLVQASRLGPYAHSGLTTILCMNGGQADIFTENDPGQTLYDNSVTYADAARNTLGFDKILNITLVPSTAYSGWPADTGQNANRLDHNDLLLADAGMAFDAVVDLANVTGLNDPESANYSDGLHWTGAGCSLAADEVEPELAPLLAA